MTRWLAITCMAAMATALGCREDNHIRSGAIQDTAEIDGARMCPIVWSGVRSLIPKPGRLSRATCGPPRLWCSHQHGVPY